MFNSLKGKILVAAGALAFFVCSFGLISYLLISFVVDDTFYSVFIPFLFVAAVVMVFGWWLANEVLYPIEKVTLLARSLERNPSTTLPKTSGSRETDEILQTFYRNSQLVQRLIGLMEEAANGQTPAALALPNAGDRLTGSFHKLLAEVSQSINARHELEQLRLALGKLKDETSRVRNGSLDSEITTNCPELEEISATLVFLLGELSALVAQVRNDSTPVSVLEARKLLLSVIQHEESKIRELNQAAGALAEIPGSLQKITESFSSAVLSAHHSIEKTRAGALITQDNLTAVNLFRKQLQEALRRISRLNERSQEIAQTVRAIEDLAHRTNMIALNAAIQVDKLRDKDHGFAAVAEEIERLAARAGNTNKQISSLNQSVLVETSEVERSLKAAAHEAAGLSKYAVETGNLLNELEKHLVRVLSLQDQLSGYSSEQTAEAEKAFRSFMSSVDETQKSCADLKEMEKVISRIIGSFDRLQAVVADFRLPEPAADQYPVSQSAPAAEPLNLDV